MRPYLEAAIIGAILLAFFAVLALITRYTSRWYRLERLYPLRPMHGVVDYGLQWVNIASPVDPAGIFNRFVWGITVSTSDEGVRFSLIFPYQLLMRPVVVPWQDVMIVEQSFIGTTRCELIPRNAPELQFIISKSLGRRLNEQSAKPSTQ